MSEEKIDGIAQVDQWCKELEEMKKKMGVLSDKFLYAPARNMTLAGMNKLESAITWFKTAMGWELDYRKEKGYGD